MNMKKTSLLCMLALTLASSIRLKAQEVPILEKTHDVSRKARNGYLGGIEMNKEKETIDMIYVLPSLLPRKVKTEIYTYDKDLNLINTVKEEEFLEKVKTRWKWFNYRGDIYVTTTLTASTDLGGKLVFRKKLITYNYNWYYGSYMKKVKQLEKVKPTTDTDAKYVYKCSYEVAADSTVLVIAGIPEKKTQNAWKKFEIMSCDNQVNIKTIGKIDFEFPVQPFFSAPLQDDNTSVTNDDSPRDWIIIFAPMGSFKEKDPNPNNYTYIRLSPKGELKERFNFTSPSTAWRVQGAYEKEGSVFLYGSAINKEGKYAESAMNNSLMVPTTSASMEEKKLGQAQPAGPMGGFGGMSSMDFGQTQEELDLTLDELKYTNFQIGKVSNGKFDFISSPSIEEFEKKQAKTVDQKKFVVFDGKKFVVNGISFTSSGDIFISGQDFVKKDNDRIFKGIYMFQFEPNGTLKKNYGVFVDQKKKKGFFNDANLTSDMVIASNYIYESADKQSLYWLLKSAKNVECTGTKNANQNTQVCKPLFGFDYGAIKITNGELSEFKTFGEDEKRTFYLFENTGGYVMNNYLFFFSESLKGGQILLTRMDLTK